MPVTAVMSAANRQNKSGTAEVWNAFVSCYPGDKGFFLSFRPLCILLFKTTICS